MSLLSPYPIDFDETWKLLEKSLLNILTDINKGFPNDKWMTLFTGVYKICTKPMDAQPGKLYFKLKEVLEDYVERVLQGLLAYEACTPHCSLDLLTRYRNAFENYSVSMRYGSELFRYLDRHWIKTNHCETGQSPQEGVYTVYEMALIVWKNIVFAALKHKLCSHMLHVINEVRERNLSVFDNDGVIGGIITTYEVLGMEHRERSKFFQKELEDHIVADTHRYYRRRGTALLNTHPVRMYLRVAEQLLADEKSRASSCFGHLTTRRMLIATQVSLIGLHSERLVDEARRMLIAGAEQRDDLRRLYFLIAYLDNDTEAPGICSGIGIGTLQPRPIPGNASFNLIGRGADDNNSVGVLVGGGPLVLTDNPSMRALQLVVQEHIRTQGLLAVKEAQMNGGQIKGTTLGGDTDDAASLGESARGGTCSDKVVMAMLEVHEHYRDFIEESFMDAPAFKTVLDEACKSFVNAMPGAPEWLARHAHCLLDRSYQQKPRIDEATRFEALDRVGFLFSYVADKDVFHKYYAKLLSKRIIQLTSVSNDAEERMLDNMRKISGFEYTSKLQRMFVDKALSCSLHTGYVEWLEARTQRLQAALLSTGGINKTIFTFTNDDEEASRMLEEMSVSSAGTPLTKFGPRSGVEGTSGSPPQSPMYFSPKGVSPRTNMLPSFEWGKILLRSMRKHTSTGSRAGGQGEAAAVRRLIEESYGEKRAGGGGVGFEAFTFVLTAGCWPLQSVNSTFSPPAPIQNYVKRFLEYYNDVHSRRKLEWLYHLGHGEIMARCFDKPYCINSSTFQMGVLYQFNTQLAIPVSDIALAIAISDEELSRHLFPLIKAGLLIVVDKEGIEQTGVCSCDDLKSTHVITINKNFSNKRTHIKVNIVDHSKQSSKRDIPPQELIADRSVSLQATICRIMKTRREMAHKELCIEVKNQISHLFVPDVPFIKTCIEILISKEFLVRLEGVEAYKYCA